MAIASAYHIPTSVFKGAGAFEELFGANRTIIAIMSSGIVIRALGDLVQDKRNEAPVLCISEDGASVVPLLGGHRGANTLALTIAHGLETRAAITTAGESRFPALR